LIENLIDTCSSDKGKDTMGIPLLIKTSIQQIWEEQKQHISCIQHVGDPAIQLYTQTGTLKKGGVELPIYRCARESTSLESFHLHVHRFIPGTIANDVHFQCYLLEGIVRWNEDRALAAMIDGGEKSTTSSYSSSLKYEKWCIVKSSKRTLTILASTQKMGVEYLYSQTGKTWSSDVSRLDPDEPDELTDELTDDSLDEGFVESEEVDPTVGDLEPSSTDQQPSSAITPQSSSQEDSSTRNEEPPRTDIHVPSDTDDTSDTELQETVGPLGILVWEQIQQLTNALFELRDCTALTE
ncbi:unnamed protein product, partial [Porites evermanni]